MRLIIEYTSGDGYSSIGAKPNIYESVEKFLSDFETACKNAYEDSGYGGKFQVGNDFYYVSDFISHWSSVYNKPKVYTVDEWFSRVECIVNKTTVQ